MCGSTDDDGKEWPQFGQRWSVVVSFPIVAVGTVDVAVDANSDVDGIVDGVVDGVVAVGANDNVMVVDDMTAFSVVDVVACPILALIKLLFMCRCYYCSLLRLMYPVFQLLRRRAMYTTY